jgi:hypothetical protein
MSESPEQILSKFTQEEKKKFQSRICKYICENHYGQKIFHQIDLLKNTGLHAFIDEKMQTDFTYGRRGTVYKLLMDEVMNSLVDRGAVKLFLEQSWGNTTLNYYKVLERLTNNCESFTVSRDVDIDEIIP